MVPRREIVAGPGEPVSLAASVGRTRKNKRALIGTQLQQSFISGARIFQSDDIVNFGVRRGPRSEAGLINAVDRIEWHGLGRAVKYRWLVHVIPEPGDTVFHKALVKT